MQELISFLFLGLFGVMVVVVLFAIINAVTGIGKLQEKCKGHSWDWVIYDHKEVLQCKKCLKTFEEVLRDD